MSLAYDGDEWTIDVDMIDVYVSDTVGFFEEIAHTRGTDVRPWRSEFAEVELRPTDLGNGIIALDFSFWWSRGGTLDNERQGQLQVRADALPEFAAKIRELTGLKGPAGRLLPAR